MPEQELQEARNRYQQGNQAYDNQNFEEALRQFDAAIDLYKQVLADDQITGDERSNILRNYADTLNFKGAVLTEKGESPESARRIHRQALSFYEEIQDVIGRASALYGIAETYRVSEEWIQSISSLSQALDLLDLLPGESAAARIQGKSFILNGFSKVYADWAVSLDSAAGSRYPARVGGD